MRYFLKLAYNGSGFHGWQMQDNASSIQQELTEKLSLVLSHSVSITGCGRTDTGVHAKEFYAHFDTGTLVLSKDDLLFKINNMLDKNIVVYDLLPVITDAHTRFNAIKRTYEYIIIQKKDPFIQGLAYRYNIDLNLGLMNQACQSMLGEKDFNCFCKTNTNNHTTICNVSVAEWSKEDNMVLKFRISADRFLRNMVRAIVGTMLEIGRGKMTLEEFRSLLHSGTRSDAGPSVPAHGLYLTAVEYPTEIFQVDP